MKYNIFDLKKIMAQWYFNYCNLHQSFEFPAGVVSWKSPLLEEIYYNFQDFLRTDDMYILNKNPKELDLAHPFYFANTNERQMFVWNTDNLQYEPVFKDYDILGDYNFLYVNKLYKDTDFRFIDYSLKSVSYSILKNHHFKFKSKVFENLGIAVLYSEEKKHLCKYSFMGVETYGHMIICPIAKNTHTEIAKNKKHFLLDKSIVRKMLIS